MGTQKAGGSNPSILALDILMVFVGGVQTPLLFSHQIKKDMLKFLRKKRTTRWKKVWYVYSYSTGLFSFLSNQTHIEDFGTWTAANNHAAALNQQSYKHSGDIGYAVSSRWDEIKEK